MKLSIALLATLAASASAFSPVAFVQPSATIDRTSVVLAGSKNADKIASRSKWAEERGIGVDAADESSEVAAGLMTNDDGLEYVKLVNPSTGASAEVYLFGGVVTSYVDGDGQEFIAVRPDAKMDGSKPISGGKLKKSCYFLLFIPLFCLKL